MLSTFYTHVKPLLSSRSNVKHERSCFTTFLNIEKRVLNTTRSGVVLFRKQVRGSHQVSKREKHLKRRGLRPSGFIVLERLETW